MKRGASDAVWRAVVLSGCRGWMWSGSAIWDVSGADYQAEVRRWVVAKKGYEEGKRRVSMGEEDLKLSVLDS